MSDSQEVKPAYVGAVEAFKEADKKYKDAEEAFFSGALLVEICASTSSPDDIRDAWRQALDQLRMLLEDRNSRLKDAQNALRPAVQLGEMQERGPEGKPTVVREGPFSVASMTYRGFEAEDLIELCKKKGVLQELLDSTILDDKGVEHRIVEKQYKINYEAVRNFLLQRQLNDILRAAYCEEEGTPRVSGPKRLAFLGDKVDSSKPGT